MEQVDVASGRARESQVWQKIPRPWADKQTVSSPTRVWPGKTRSPSSTAYLERTSAHDGRSRLPARPFSSSRSNLTSLAAAPLLGPVSPQGRVNQRPPGKTEVGTSFASAARLQLQPSRFNTSSHATSRVRNTPARNCLAANWQPSSRSRSRTLRSRWRPITE